MPPIPHIAVAGEVAESEAAETAAPGKTPFWKKRVFQYVGSGVVLLIVVLVKFGWGVLTQATSDTIRDKINKPEAPETAPAPKATPPAPAPSGGKSSDGPNKATQSPGLSPTQSDIAHAPGSAVKKASDLANTRRNSDQTKAGDLAAGDDSANKPAVTPEKAAGKAGPTAANVATSLAPGVSAPTQDISAAAEASGAFRAFIASARIGGLFQGATPRVLINGRTVRAGDTVDATLGVLFDGYDPEKKQLLFKDKTGAVVTRRYP
jgi:hypothetical protein